MAKNRQPVAKRCKALGISPAAMGYYKKETTRNSNTQSRKKKSEYALQLQEKQKVKFVYGVLEKQFRGYMRRPSACPARPAQPAHHWSAV
jgi:small subunit ribosomal protein S4